MIPRYRNSVMCKQCLRPTTHKSDLCFQCRKKLLREKPETRAVPRA